MFALLHSLAMFVIDFFKSPRRLEVENLFLRHQLSIALRRAPPRLRLRGSDRALLVWMTRSISPLPPKSLIEIYPEWRGHMYFVVGDRQDLLRRWRSPGSSRSSMSEVRRPLIGGLFSLSFSLRARRAAPSESAKKSPARAGLVVRMGKQPYLLPPCC